MTKIPNYLKDYAAQYENDPRAANLEWFKNTHYGMFIHYGLFSLLQRHEWIQFKEQIYVADYEPLIEKFTAENFDAGAIAKFAKDCGMRYINLTTRHHDCFCIWPTKYTDFNIMNSPAKRDLVGELAEACEKQGLGFFLYYSHGRDWKHPHAPHNDKYPNGNAAPAYEPPEPSYKYGDEHDLNIYLEFMSNQVKELLDNYPTVAGIWLDGIAVPLMNKKEEFKCEELYDLIRNSSPHALVSYKQGLHGTEDFFAPEHKALEDNQGKIIEVCTTMIKEPLSWGYYKDAVHRNEEEVWEKLTDAVSKGYNLLLNTGPLPDGSLDPQDVPVLLNIGKKIKEEKLFS